MSPLTIARRLARTIALNEERSNGMALEEVAEVAVVEIERLRATLARQNLELVRLQSVIVAWRETWAANEAFDEEERGLADGATNETTDRLIAACATLRTLGEEP